MESEVQETLAKVLNKVFKKKFESGDVDYFETSIEIDGLGSKCIQIAPKNHKPIDTYKEHEEFIEFKI